jgi:hypothetical protein
MAKSYHSTVLIDIQVYLMELDFLGANCDTEHYLLVANVRETLLGSSSIKA